MYRVHQTFSKKPLHTLNGLKFLFFIFLMKFDIPSPTELINILKNCIFNCKLEIEDG